MIAIWNRLNEWLAIRANAIFASMAMFWFCNALVVVGLSSPRLMPYIQFISSAWIQLVALPLIAVGTILAARNSDKQAKEQHDAVMEMAIEMREILADVRESHAALHDKVDTKL